MPSSHDNFGAFEVNDMPTSLPVFDSTVVAWVKEHAPAGLPILDVGAGSGKYGRLLRNVCPEIDCVEVYAPYIEKFALKEVYRKVYAEDIRNFLKHAKKDVYGLAIMGDILEHLGARDGPIVVRRLLAIIPRLIVVVPYKSVQGAYRGVESEIHLQADLTPEIMSVRYPDLELLTNTMTKGVYYGDKH